MTYQLRRLRLHGLIERVPGSHRYHVTARGLRIALFFTRVYARLFRPGLAAVMPDAVRENSRLRRAFDRLEHRHGGMVRGGETRRMKLDSFTTSPVLQGL